MEALEERLVPVTSNYSLFAQSFPRHSGPTVLYLNFDGWAAQKVASFQGTTVDRNQDIQEILYRTAELFAPFDVQVGRIRGDGAMSTANGNTTIFIGDDSDNGTGTSNGAYASTPADHTDMPGSALGLRHTPNSNDHDFAFVDPIGFNPTLNMLVSLNNLTIAQNVAHEAGHTFGLGHIRSVGTDNLSDFSTIPAFSNANPPEIMSYDSPNRLFADQTFNLTAANNTGTSTVYQSGLVPKWADTVFLGIPISTTTMQTQNSFTFLTAVLGSRPDDDFANVADSTSVAHMSGTMPSVAVGSNMLGFIDRFGDYDVFQFTPTTTQSLMVNAQRVPGSTPDPVLMVFEGSSLLAFNDNRTTADFSSRITRTFTAGHTYRIVVGAADGASIGRYRFWLNVPGATNPDNRGPLVLSAELRGGTRYHPLPTYFLVKFNEDVNPSTLSVADVRFVNSAGMSFAPSYVTEVSGSYHRQWRLYFPSTLREDDYTLQIGPNLNDFAGNLMNQDNDGVNGEATQDRYTHPFEYVYDEPYDARSASAASVQGSDPAASSGAVSSAVAARRVSNAARPESPPAHSRMASARVLMYLHDLAHREARSDALMDALAADVADPLQDKLWASFAKSGR
jgi:hypothetical protein